MDVIKEQVFHLSEWYEGVLKMADPRVADWFLMQCYYPTLLLTAAYLFIVWIGPYIMKNREPVQMKYTLFFYNIGLVALNFHIFFELATATIQAGYSYVCQPVTVSYDYHEMRIAKALWWYYFSKMLEFWDTFFFILRKKNNQVSFLHVYHHASMFPIWWIGVKWVPGGQSFFGAMINSFIHVLMYSYYGVSALGPQYQKYLWWKKYLTRLQLLQFIVCLIKVVHSIYTGCEFPLWMQYTSVVYGWSLVALFANFYYMAYVKSQQSTKKVQFVVGMCHAGQSLVLGCAFPLWMQWALIFYGGSILSLFLNFYFHAYVKNKKQKSAKKSDSSNGHVTNGVSNGTTKGHSQTNGATGDSKKSQ